MLCMIIHNGSCYSEHNVFEEGVITNNIFKERVITINDYRQAVLCMIIRQCFLLF